MHIIKTTGLTALVLALCTSSISAPLQPVSVAFELYTGCVNGYLQSADVDSTKDTEIKEYIRSVDENCINWMLVWYKPISELKTNIHEWPTSQVKMLDARRIVFLSRLFNELKESK